MSLLDTFYKLQSIKQQQEQAQMQQLQTAFQMANFMQKMKEMQRGEALRTDLSGVSPYTEVTRPTSGLVNLPEGYDVPDPASMMTERTPKPIPQIYRERGDVYAKHGSDKDLEYYTKAEAIEEKIRKENEPKYFSGAYGLAKVQPQSGDAQVIVEPPEKEAKAPTTRHYTRGNEEITEEYDSVNKVWNPVANAPRYKPDTGASGLPKPPKDFRYTPDGELEPIPGGKEDAKRRTNYAKADKQYRGITSGLKTLKQQTEKLMNHPGLGKITGAMGVVPNFPGSDAANADAILEQLKSRTGLDVLQNMRLLSPTGGALGNVSDAEGKRLETYIAALSKAQSKPAMKAALQDILNYADDAERNLKDGFEQTFSDSDKERYSGKKSGTQQPAPSGKFKILKVK